MKKILFALAMLMFLAADSLMAQQYQVGVCDWMILKRQKIGAFARASEIGADGLELDMGGLGARDSFDNKLRDSLMVRRFKAIADSLHQQIGAVAMSGFYGQSLLKKATYRALIADCFNTMDAMGGVEVAFLPLGGCGNWANDATMRKALISRLHEIGEMARLRGKCVGIDTPLDAKGNLKLLKAINSSGIKIFYKWQNILENGWDLPRDLKRLGAKNICAMHASNSDSVCLRDDKAVDIAAIKETLDQMGWSGWLFVERSRDVRQVRNVVANYSNNVHYLKSVFNSLPTPDVALDSTGRDPQYVQTILVRARKVTDALNLTYTPKGQNVRNTVANRYFELNDIYAERDSLRKTNRPQADAQADSKLYRSHFAFSSRLSLYLQPEQVECVKDVMTYNVVKVTYEAQCDMIPTLTAEEKAQILAWLKEAREFAIDAESSKKKHECFGKYKGRINNYLAKRGYNLTKEREEWAKRVKARGGTL